MDKDDLIWYLHIDGMHHSEYTNKEQAAKVAMSHFEEGHAVHLQTRNQWLREADAYDEKIEKIIASWRDK